jgi:hypothetical protein
MMRITAQDMRTIAAIADRAVALLKALDQIEEYRPKLDDFWRIAIADEIFIVHRDIVPLRLADFLNADDGNFAHDIGGIHRHLERRAGKPPRLNDCFLPRFASINGRELE